MGGRLHGYARTSKTLPWLTRVPSQDRRAPAITCPGAHFGRDWNASAPSSPHRPPKGSSQEDHGGDTTTVRSSCQVCVTAHLLMQAVGMGKIGPGHTSRRTAGQITPHPASGSLPYERFPRARWREAKTQHNCGKRTETLSGFIPHRDL